MKILLLVPPADGKIPERIYGCSYAMHSEPELPLLYVAAVLRAAGHTVDFIDFVLEKTTHSAFASYIAKSNFDAFVIHTVLLSKDIDLKAAKTIRGLKPDAPVIFFGPEPTRTPEEFLFDSKIFVVRGEPELIFKELFNYLEKGRPPIGRIKGVSWLKNGKPIHNATAGVIPNLDMLPFPARDLIEKYKDKYYNAKLSGRPYSIILTSRGCPFRCYFCVPNAISWARELEWRKYHNGAKPPVGIRSAGNVVEEFHQIAAAGCRSVWIIDDMFLYDQARVKRILESIKPLGLEFGALARADFVNPKIAKLLKEAGCRVIDMGIESFDQKVLDYVKKDLKTEAIYNAIAALKGVNVQPEINLMFGTCPYETPKSIKETVKKAIALDVDYVLFSIATPFPGTELEAVARKRGWLIQEKFSNLTESLDPASKAMMNMPHLSAAELEKLERYAKCKFYFRPKYVARRLAAVKSLKELIELARTAWRLLITSV